MKGWCLGGRLALSLVKAGDGPTNANDWRKSLMCRVECVSLGVNDEKCVHSAVVSYAPWSSSSESPQQGCCLKASTYVLALVPWPGDRSASVKSSSYQFREMGRKRKISLTRVHERIRRDAIFGGQIGSVQRNAGNNGVLVCHCSNGQS